jgi:hypothetical protein
VSAAATKSRVAKCSRARWCSCLDERLADENNAHAKGFGVVVVTSIETGKSRVLGVRYRKTTRDPGLMLNHCPFCGVRIDWEFRDERGTAKRGGR